MSFRGIALNANAMNATSIIEEIYNTVWQCIMFCDAESTSTLDLPSSQDYNPHIVSQDSSVGRATH
jgi:hypothetical protein